MGERLSAASAIVGLVAVGGRIMEKMWELTPAPALTRPLHEIKQCRSTVHVLYKTFCELEAARLPFPERASWIAVDDVVAALTDTVLALSDLQAICDAALERRPRAAPDAAVDALCSRIRWQALSMNIMMTILKCPGVADAASARVGLQRRMARLLTPDTALSRRMRLAARGFGPPHHTQGPTAPPRPPMPFSGHTLADVPALSLVPLPVTTGELCDGRELYTAAYARLAGPDVGGLLGDDGVVAGPPLGRSDTDGGLGSSTGTDSGNDGPVVQNGREAPTKKPRFYRIRPKRCRA